MSVYFLSVCSGHSQAPDVGQMRLISFYSYINQDLHGHLYFLSKNNGTIQNADFFSFLRSIIMKGQIERHIKFQNSILKFMSYMLKKHKRYFSHKKNLLLAVCHR